MRILLTGSSGWLGRFLAPMLRGAGHEVVGLDVAPGEDTQILGSVADRDIVERAFAGGVEAVVHAGALHKPDIARHPTQAFIEVNVTGTLNLLQASVAAGVGRFVFTSSTSLMISKAIRDETGASAAWIDETSGPLEPRNIYGVTKLAAEGLCRIFHQAHGLPCLVLRTSRFFPEDDDTHAHPSGENLKANELLYRRLTVEDAARAHLLALDQAPAVGFDVLVISAPTPFTRADAAELKRDAAAVVRRLYPGAAALFAARGWELPATIGRVYDAARAERVIGFRADADFAAVLEALRAGRPLPVAHDPAYVSPLEVHRSGATAMMQMAAPNRQSGGNSRAGGDGA
jgi:nucleoside-diphosphate-sugar epimerase